MMTKQRDHNHDHEHGDLCADLHLCIIREEHDGVAIPEGWQALWRSLLAPPPEHPAAPESGEEG